MPEVPDQTLARQAQAGSVEAFEALLTRHERRVAWLCERILGNRADAEDATISACVKAWRWLRRYDSSRPFVPWLLTIASREALTLARNRPTWTSLDDLTAGEEDVRPGGGGDPAEAALAGETREALLDAVARLDSLSRAAVVLRYHLDLSYAEIARLLEIPPGTVGTLLHRARHRLRGWLAGDEGDSAGKVTVP
ncbi:MAG: RNA polymerase sigma factor [Betaproteobacteria bacterium]